MSRSRAELDSMLDELERDLAMLVLNEADHDDLWAAFAGQADAICANAGADDIAHVRARMDAILLAQGIEPSEPATSSAAAEALPDPRRQHGAGSLRVP